MGHVLAQGNLVGNILRIKLKPSPRITHQNSLPLYQVSNVLYIFSLPVILPSFDCEKWLSAECF